MPEDQEDVAKRIREIDQRLTDLSNRWYERPFHEPRSVVEQLYVSPRFLLIFITLLNVALFIGGTVYTGVQVDSIQKRYQEASIKILEAKQKYDEADSKLKSIQVLLGDTQRQSTALLTDMRRSAKDNSEEISRIKDESEQQLDLLKKSSAATLASMDSYKGETEAALEKAARDVAVKLEHEIQFNKEAIEKKQANIDALGLQIQGLSAKVEGKALEVDKIQRHIEDQLITAVKLNDEFAGNIKKIERSGKITVPVAYRISDLWLKALLVLSFLICLLPGLFALRR